MLLGCRNTPRSGAQEAGENRASADEYRYSKKITPLGRQKLPSGSDYQYRLRKPVNIPPLYPVSEKGCGVSSFRRKALTLDWLDGGTHTPRSRRFTPNRPLRDLVEPPHLVADADQKHWLPGVLQEIDDPVLLVLEINRLAIRQ